MICITFRDLFDLGKKLFSSGVVLDQNPTNTHVTN